MDINEQDFDEWQKAKERLDIAKKVELACRIKVCEAMFGSREGEFKIEDENVAIGRKIAATSKVNRNVDWEELGFDADEFQEDARDLLAGLMQDLTEEELGVIDIKISLNTSRYKKAEDMLDNINECLVVTPGTPTLSVKFKD